MSSLNTVEEILTRIKSLPIMDQARLKDMLFSENESKHLMDEYLEEQRFSDGRVCPHCGCVHVRKNGHRKNGTQKFICNECGKSFTLRTKTIFNRTRKGLDTWQKFMACMADKKSLDKCAEICGITHATAFAWRHKVLDALNASNESSKLGGVVESDETFFAKSYKGNAQHFEANGERAARKRGGEIHRRGLSDELVCVPCAVDNKGNAVSKVAKLGKCSAKALQYALGDAIVPQSTICSDGDSTYKSFAKSNELKLVQIIGGKRSKGEYNIQRINSYHQKLKKFLHGFYGVSTKYLNNYLLWNNTIEYCKVYLENRLTMLSKTIAKVSLTIRTSDLKNRPEVPVIA